jgi:hypothetical protein
MVEREGQRILGRIRCRIKDNIQMDIHKFEWGMDWIVLT